MFVKVSLLLLLNVYPLRIISVNLILLSSLHFLPLLCFFRSPSPYPRHMLSSSLNFETKEKKKEREKTRVKRRDRERDREKNSNYLIPHRKSLLATRFSDNTRGVEWEGGGWGGGGRRKRLSWKRKSNYSTRRFSPAFSLYRSTIF